MAPNWALWGCETRSLHRYVTNPFPCKPIKAPLSNIYKYVVTYARPIVHGPIIASPLPHQLQVLWSPLYTYCMYCVLYPSGTWMYFPAIFNGGFRIGSSTKYMYTEFQSVCTLVRIGTSPPPLPRKRVCLSTRNQKGRGYTRLRGWGYGGSQFGRLEKRPSTLSTLWAQAFPICIFSGDFCFTVCVWLLTGRSL